MRPRSRNEFETAIICALPLEFDAIGAVLDEYYDGLGSTYGKQYGDANWYRAGRVGQHNIVLTCLPAMGKGNAASAASSLRISFPQINLALLVGICGGVPFPSGQTEIILGDVIISDRVVEYDFGRQYPNRFERKGVVRETLGGSNRDIRAFLVGLKTHQMHIQLQDNLLKYLQNLQQHPNGRWQYPGIARDQLFNASYRHKHHHEHHNTPCLCMDCQSSSDPVCEKALETDCRKLGCIGELIPRSRLSVDLPNPQICFGSLASADTVMKSGEHRDQLADTENVIGFEMEGAGIWDNLPCIIIKGVCDYADSHKNKVWQNYAAATAASSTKAFLDCWEATVTDIKINDNNQCLRELFVSDPRVEKERIEQTKGGLLYTSFSWILENDKFQQWRYSSNNRLLWVKGDAGKGKTMLLIGIINELRNKAQSVSLSDGGIVLYFLCQATDSRLNNALAILRGLIYLLITQQPGLAIHLQDKYEHTGSKLFDDSSAFYCLSEVFKEMLLGCQQTPIYLAIDALDECEAGLSQLLNIITQTVDNFNHIKWVVSSRNRNDIEQLLGFNDSRIRISLELNARYVSGAINAFIKHKVSQLVVLHHDKLLQENVCEQLRQKSDGTFLWVALVIQEIQHEDVIAADVLDVLKKIPNGLNPLYYQIMKQISKLQSGSLQRCLLVLSRACLTYRPLQLHEMHTITGLREEFLQLEDLQRIIHMCGSFLTVRDNYVYFIHQSAKDYLVMNEYTTIFPHGSQQMHHEIYLQSLKALSKTLRQNIYDLRDFGPIIGKYVPDPDPLAPVRYSCVSWFNHLCECDIQALEYSHELIDSGRVFTFLKNHLLHWIESLSLIHEISGGALILERLLHNVQAASGSQFITFLQDAKRFLLGYRAIIEQAPLQTYGSALVFCPLKSEIKRQYWQKRIPCIKYIGGIRDSWDPCLQTLEGHTDWVLAVAFSPDGRTLASASHDKTVQLWEVATGIKKWTLQGHVDSIRAVTFSPDGQMLASASDDKTIWLWEVATGIKKQTLQGHTGLVQVATFSPDGHTLASASHDKTIRLWEVATGIEKQTLQGHIGWVGTVAFSPDGQMLALAPDDKTVRLWEVTTGIEKQTLQGHIDSVGAVAFSPDGQTLASASDDKTVRLWEVATGIKKQTLQGHTDWVGAVAFSPDGQTLASASHDETVRLWEVATGIEKQTLQGHTGWVRAVAFSPDGQMLASASGDKTIRLWEVAIGIEKQTLCGHTDWVGAVAFSPDGRTLASASHDETVRLWEVATGIEKQTLQGHTAIIKQLSFSNNGEYLKTNRGMLSLNPVLPDIPDRREQQSFVIFVSEKWVIQNGQKILWLPPDYRATCVAVHQNCLVMGHPSGQITFSRF